MKDHPLIKALRKKCPVIYFDNPNDYRQFIKEIFKENPDPRKQYCYLGMRIVIWKKDILSLLHNDYLLKEIR